MTKPEWASKARYIMIGGFLGAGKTTALARLAARFVKDGVRVGLITNDQGTELVDTATLRARGFATEEIGGGCFCCRFTSLTEAAQRLTETTRPDVFIAEPVGSCTDLVATVSYPLRRIYGSDFSLAPLSVLIDPIRALRVLAGEGARSFSGKVRYIYRKQLEEADLIVINKIDVLERAQIELLREKISSEFPQAKILEISAREGAGLDEWFEVLKSAEQSARPSMEVDYDIYAEGEAMLGWLNATLQITADAPVDANEFLETFAGEIQRDLQSQGVEIAHLKMTLSPDGALESLASISLVGSDFIPELSLRLEEPVGSGEVIVNLRAEADSETLRAALIRAIGSVAGNLSLEIGHIENFQPGRPNPTHRMSGTEAVASGSSN